MEAVFAVLETDHDGSLGLFQNQDNQQQQILPKTYRNQFPERALC